MVQPLTAIKSIAFLDADGREIKSQRTGAGRLLRQHRPDDSTYSLEKKVNKATVKVTYFETENLSVPVNLTVNVGF